MYRIELLLILEAKGEKVLFAFESCDLVGEHLVLDGEDLHVRPADVKLVGKFCILRFKGSEVLTAYDGTALPKYLSPRSTERVNDPAHEVYTWALGFTREYIDHRLFREVFRVGNLLERFIRSILQFDEVNEPLFGTIRHGNVFIHGIICPF